MAIVDLTKVSFEGEWEKEQVLFLLRAHFITNLGWILVAVLAFFVPLPIWLFLKFSPQNLVGISLASGFLVTLVWFLIIFGLAFQKYLFWYFNIYILTNNRIVDFDFISLFSHKVSQATLENIQDVSFEKKGIFQNFFDFGDIKIQTAAEVENFVFERIADPEGCSKQILELISKGGKRL